MNKKIVILSFIILIAALISCSSVSIEEQRVVATAYVEVEMEQAKTAAEQAALSLCNVDLSAGMATYQQKICALATQAGCQIISDQIKGVWQNFQTAYQIPQLNCELVKSQLIEETRQFGMDVQFWQVKLNGENYAPQNSSEREYWLQVANENGQWKLNRVLLVDEIRYYLASDSLVTIQHE